MSGLFGYSRTAFLIPNAPGTKLKTISCDTSRFTKRSASRKSFLRPRRPRLDKACANNRCSVPDIRPAAARLGHLGFQYRSSAPQTGFQYCTVDSITTSSICCSMSHSDSARNCSGLLPYQRRSGYRRSQRRETTHHLFARPRTLRIKLRCGFNISTVLRRRHSRRSGLLLGSERFSWSSAGRRP